MGKRHFSSIGTVELSIQICLFYDVVIVQTSGKQILVRDEKNFNWTNFR